MHYRNSQLDEYQRQEFKGKLTKAFKQVRQTANVLARQSHLCCMSCATSDLGQKLEGSSKAGAVYYHRQDAEHIDDGYVWVRFFPADESDEASLHIASLACAAFAAQGLRTIWNGSPDTCIVAYTSAIDNRVLSDLIEWLNR